MRLDKERFITRIQNEEIFGSIKEICQHLKLKRILTGTNRSLCLVRFKGKYLLLNSGTYLIFQWDIACEIKFLNVFLYVSFTIWSLFCWKCVCFFVYLTRCSVKNFLLIFLSKSQVIDAIVMNNQELSRLVLLLSSILSRMKLS